MGSIRSWMLAAAFVAGGLGLGAASAQAGQFGVYVGGPATYVPPCPGPGYVWSAGYISDGYRVPGRWNFVGIRDHDRRFAYVDRDRDRRDFDRRDHDRDRGRDFDRGRDRNRDGDHDRGGDRFRR
jgi:hypothetical protein